MAELGVVSSGLGIASLAIQVADSVMKLKSFIDSVREAPEEIKYIIRQIEALNLVLSGCDTEDDEAEVSEAVSNATKTCQVLMCRAVGGLELVLKELEVAIGKKRVMGSLKTVLRQSTVDKLRQRLRDAQDFLVLSNQYYSQALQKRRHDIQRRWAEAQVLKLSNLEMHITECTEAVRSIPQRSETSFHPRIEEVPSSESDEACQNSSHPAKSENEHERKALVKSCKRVTSSLARQKEILARLKLPSWLRMTSLCLEICGQRSLYGMSLDVKVYRIVSSDAPVMEFARAGNVVAIQEMFSNRTATPHDITIYGWSILEVAAYYLQVEVCRLLMREGAYKYAKTAERAYYYTIEPVNPLRDLNKRLDVVQTLAEGVDYKDLLDLETSSLRAFRGTVNILSWILHNSNYSGQKLTVENRARLAIHLGAIVLQPRVALLIRFLLPEPQDILTACRIIGSGGATLIYSAARALGEQGFRARQTARIKGHGRTKASSDRFEFNHQTESDCLQDLLSLIKELIAAGSNLQGCDTYNTPLAAIIFGFADISWFCLYFRGISSADGFLDLPVPVATDSFIPLMMWLELLYECGIDLVDYGRKENQLLQEGRRIYSFQFPIGRRPRSPLNEDIEWFSIRFKYGPKPSDWQFWLIEEMDDSFAEFWDMINHPERAMPGSWDDRFDS